MMTKLDITGLFIGGGFAFLFWVTIGALFTTETPVFWYKMFAVDIFGMMLGMIISPTIWKGIIAPLPPS